MISRALKTVIGEAIQTHADRFRSGRVNLEKTVSALGAIAAEYLSEIPDQLERDHAFRIFLSGVFTAAEQRAKGKDRPPSSHRH